MTPAQQAALEAVAGRPLSAAEIADIDLHLDPDSRNDVAIAVIINAGRPTTVRSLRVDEVFEVLFFSGDYSTLKAAQLQGQQDAVLAFEMLKDAKQIGPGLVNIEHSSTVGMFDGLQVAGLLTAAGRAALVERATTQVPPIHYNQVSDALNQAEGRMTL